MCPPRPGTPIAGRHGGSQGDALRDSNFGLGVQACYECAVACDACAAMCLREDAAGMQRAIGLCTDCAAVCRLCAAMLARDGEFAKGLCALCAQLCDACARACSASPAQHCQICAGACLGCALACRDMLGP